MNILLDTVAILLILITLAPHLPSSHWLVRVWEFPRLQILCIMLITLTASFLIRGAENLEFSTQSLLLIVLVVCAIYQAFWIYPYTPLARKEVEKAESPDQDEKISILSSNVFMPNDNYHKLLSHVKDTQPDFLVTLESNKRWQNALAELNSDYPYQKHCPLENLYGMNLYSKVPLDTVELHYYVEDDVPSFKVTFTKNNSTVTIFFLHPKPPSPTENKRAKPRDIELDLVGNMVCDYKDPVIVAGDLNDVAWSPTTRKFRKVSGLLDPRIGRGFFNTFHAHYPLIKWPLDHLFHSNHFSLVDIRKLGDIGSDHYPLLTTLQMKKVKSRK